jgi:predicted ATPase
VAGLRDLLLRDDGLLTLTGAGDRGKTRLGLRVGANALDEFHDGVFFVNLAPIVDPTWGESRAGSNGHPI